MNLETTLLPEKLSNEEYNVISILFMEYDNINDLNSKLEELTGLNTFFRDKDEFIQIQDYLINPDNLNLFDREREWGDYQTSLSLTDKICNYLSNVGFSPDVIIEPTYGRGNFIISALKHFSNAKYIYGVEIQKKYELIFKLSLLKWIAKGNKSLTKIEIFSDDIFTHIFSKELINNHDDGLLIIGNPPWITNSELSTLQSNNIPIKSNIKNFNGLDAITGKSNFDIAEYIILKMLKTFQNNKGMVAFICKNIVIRNILKELPTTQFNISEIKSLGIDAKKEFDASCDASVFIARLGYSKDYVCEISLLDEPKKIIKTFGWKNNNFVSDINKHTETEYLDGKSQLIWRQGVKHDSSKIMELKINENSLINGFKEKVNIEKNPVYPLIKSSDLKNFEILKCKKMVIITQHRVGEDTSYIAEEYPKTWNYLMQKSEYLDNRKSSIYKNKPKFSIFGIGDYSFMPYKVAVSGMYKKPIFSLIPPINNKPIMVDDTCYFLGFKSYTDALFACSLLNSKIVQELLESLVFLDSKRVYTKELLMRIDLKEAANHLSFEDIINILKSVDFQNVDKILESDYYKFVNETFHKN